MNKGETLVVRQSQLPLQIELVGDKGEREHYFLMPASRKVGACLNKVAAPLLRMIGK